MLILAMRFLVLSCLFFYIYAYYLKHKKSQYKLKSTNKVPPMWKLVSAPLKEQARQWFIKRALLKGIDWEKLSDYYKLPANMEELKELKNKIENKTICYPDYFLQPFHGYDDGNMNWQAAQENEAAALSMCANYWKGVSAIDSERWVRNNVTMNIKKYISNSEDNRNIENILDVGCSGGISTEYIKRGFHSAGNIYGLDLSPYFVSVGAFRSKEQKTNINYIHENAESTSFSDNSFDLIICNFLFHEVPPNATMTILNEMYRLLQPNGILAIVDLDPEIIRGDAILSQFRRWAFEVTEPHIYNYYKSNMTNSLFKQGFYNVVKQQNDPINSIWIGKKGDSCIVDCNDPNCNDANCIGICE